MFFVHVSCNVGRDPKTYYNLTSLQDLCNALIAPNSFCAGSWRTLRCARFVSLRFVFLVSAAASATPVAGDGEGGGQRWGHAVPAVLVQPSGGDLRDPAGVPIL